jgi:hypothetical protein
MKEDKVILPYSQLLLENRYEEIHYAQANTIFIPPVPLQKKRMDKNSNVVYTSPFWAMKHWDSSLTNRGG